MPSNFNSEGVKKKKSQNLLFIYWKKQYFYSNFFFRSNDKIKEILSKFEIFQKYFLMAFVSTYHIGIVLFRFEIDAGNDAC